MSDQFWLTKAQLKRIEPFFPRTRGIPRVDDRRVVSGIVHVIQNGLRWRDAPAVRQSRHGLRAPGAAATAPHPALSPEDGGEGFLMRGGASRPGRRAGRAGGGAVAIENPARRSFARGGDAAALSGTIAEPTGNRHARFTVVDGGTSP